MLNLAVNLSLIFTEVPLIERFALAKQHGFHAIEIQFPYTLSIEQIQQQLDLHQLELVLINAPAGDLMQGGDGLAGVPGRELEFANAIKHARLYALELNVPTVNILAGKQAAGHDLLSSLQTLASNLRFACDALQNAGITPAIEMINGRDMPGFLIQNLAQGQEMLEAVQHPALKLQYDCYHMAMMGEDILQGLKDNLDQIAHIQFADYPNRHEPSTGNINYPQLFQWIQQSPYLGFCGAEYRPSGLSSDSFQWLQSYI